MAHIPERVLKHQPDAYPLKILNRGKVRDTYELPDHPDKLLVMASDRISAFDFVLPVTVFGKGEILTAMNHFWVKKLGSIFKTDLLVCGAEIDKFLPESLRGSVLIQKRSAVVTKLGSPEVEDIVRGYLTGSGFKDYEKTNRVGGHQLPSGIEDGNKLPLPLYTPSTKAKTGHDVNITADEVVSKYGAARERMALMVYALMAEYALTRGIILADMKAEIWKDVLIDEKGTPDACRFWDKRAWEKAQTDGKLPQSLDKQFMRDECKKYGIDKLKDPEDPEQLRQVADANIEASACRKTTLIYRYIFWRLVGERIESYQRRVLGIDTSPAIRRVTVLIGSKSDLPQMKIGLSLLHRFSSVTVNIVSCHRNPDVLWNFAQKPESDVIIAGAGMAAQLPGVVKALLCQFGHTHIPVIGVGFEGKNTEQNLAATLSLEQLPGTPVELDKNGKAYFGKDGFAEACMAAIDHEFLPKAFDPKPAELNVKWD